jgi:hypothetical protein
VSTVPIVEEAQAAKEKTLEVSSLAAEPVSSNNAPTQIIDAPVEIKGDEITISQGDRKYRIRGLTKNLSQDILKVNLLAIRGDAIHVDTLDLNVDRQKTVFCKRAAEELDVKEEVIAVLVDPIHFQSACRSCNSRKLIGKGNVCKFSAFSSRSAVKSPLKFPKNSGELA